jgi:hypothetical protein
MAKAKADASHVTGVTDKPESTCDRCSPTEALNILIPTFEPTAAAAELTRAIHDGPERCRLYCDGDVVKPHFAPRLMVVARFDDKEWRWTADIVSAVGEAWEKPDKPVYKWGTRDELEAAPYQWELEVDKVKALLPQPKPELEKPWPTVSGSVNWSPSAILTPATPTDAPQTKLTEEEIRYLSGATLKPGAEKVIREFAYQEFGDWRNVKPATIKAAAKDNKEFREAVFIFPSDSTWSRALDRKDRKK